MMAPSGVLLSGGSVDIGLLVLLLPLVFVGGPSQVTSLFRSLKGKLNTNTVIL